MSIQDWPGGYIQPVPPTPSGSYQDSSADGVWTLDQVAYWVKQGLWPTSGNISPNAYIENLFGTYIYTGTSSTQTITNGINISGEGGLVWIKSRSASTGNYLFDTNRGAGKSLLSNSDYLEETLSPTTLSSFNNNGFSLGTNGGVNASGDTYVSWTFRKQPKFFDVVTYTGDGSSSRSISHNLGSAPGCIIIKCTSAGSTNWIVWHRAFTSGQNLELNTTGSGPYANAYFDPLPTSTVFTLSSVGSGGFVDNTNKSGSTYVAYLFAHEAGGFGASGSENVISCGSTIGSTTVNLGWEPQWVLSKCATSAGQDWSIADNIRGVPTPMSGNTPYSNNLMPNLANAEATNGLNGASVFFNSTGFRLNPDTTVSSATYIYIAIRRGPMQTPTTGTSVYEAFYNTTNIGNQVNGSLNTADMTMQTQAPTPLAGYTWTTFDRVRGSSRHVNTSDSTTETSGSVTFNNSQVGVTNGSWFTSGGLGYNFKRAPGFFDVVCYTGNRASGAGTTQAVTHNLKVAPELLIVKGRSNADGWQVYSATLGASSQLVLSSTAAAFSAANPNGVWNETAPTSTQFTVGANNNVNRLSSTYVAYMFATCPGVSKVGSYSGTGSLQQINCGFTTGTRFVLIKCTDTTGDWYVWDYARGIVAGNDPYLFLNSTATQVDNTDYIDTYSSGFEVTAAASTTVNISGRSYIFLAVS